MVLVEPTQKNVATIASPTWGFWGLNPIPTWLPPLLVGITSWNAPFCWSRIMPDAAVTASAGAPSPCGRGLTASRQAAASIARVSKKRLSITRPLLSECHILVWHVTQGSGQRLGFLAYRKGRYVVNLAGTSGRWL